MTAWKQLLSDEPVIVGLVITVLTTAGIITADQASVLKSALIGGVAVIVQIVTAVHVRRKVTPARKVRRMHAALNAYRTGVLTAGQPTTAGGGATSVNVTSNLPGVQAYGGGGSGGAPPQ